MLKWISPRGEEVVDDRKNLSDHDDSLLTDLVLDEIEAHVVEFENKKEELQSQSDLQNEIPTYSWLKSGDSENRPIKYLTMEERTKLHSACEKVMAIEWPITIEAFKVQIENPTSRDMIIDSFIFAVHETIASRPRIGSITADVLPLPCDDAARTLAISIRNVNHLF